MKKISFLSFVILMTFLIGGAGCDSPTINPPPNAMNSEKKMEQTSRPSPPTSTDEMKKESMKKPEEAMLQTGHYEEYEASKLARAENQTVVLFFHAKWCPTCKAADEDIISHISDIPGGINILKVDYDSSADLKKKYGVTYQHTFVQVDKNGNMIKKWSGGNTLQSILSQVQ